MKKTLVCIKQGYEPWKMAYDALEKVFNSDIEGKTVLVKPNAGRAGEKGTALCTNAEVVRGVVKFIKRYNPAEILVGDGALWGVNVWDAMKQAGIFDVCEEENVKCINLDEASPVVKTIENGVMVDSLIFSSAVFNADLVISVPVIKTHMYTGATLSIKNMKGCLYKMEKTILHRVNKPCPNPEKGRCLDYGIADMASVLLPDYSVLDGTVCMEGFGPSVGSQIDMDLVVASKDPTAADFTALELMGMQSGDVSHIQLVHERCGTAGADEREVEPADYLKWAKKFKSADLSGLDNVCPNIALTEKGTCSACSAAVMTFILNKGGDLPENLKIKLATGKDLTPCDMAGDETFLIGNCAGSSAKKYGLEKDFCKGCPPVASSIWKCVNNK